MDWISLVREATSFALPTISEIGLQRSDLAFLDQLFSCKNNVAKK